MRLVLFYAIQIQDKLLPILKKNNKPGAFYAFCVTKNKRNPDEK